MNKELAFAKKLEEIRKLAKEQGNMLSQEQVETAFNEIEISKEQLEPVFAYLKSKNIGIGEPVDIEEVLSKEDKDYLTEYYASGATRYIGGYAAEVKEEQISSDITGTYNASGKYGSGAEFTSSAFSDTFTIVANNDSKGQYKITGMFNVYGGGGGTYYANFNNNVLTILAENSMHDNYLGGSLPNNITMNYSNGKFTVSESILIANLYGITYVGKDYTATRK